ANSSRGSSNPGVRGSARAGVMTGAGAATGVGVAVGAGAVAGVGTPAGEVGILDNLVYGIDNHVVHRSPAGWPGSRGWRNPMTSFPLPDHTLGSAPGGSRTFPEHTLGSAPGGSRTFPEHTLRSPPLGA